MKGILFNLGAAALILLALVAALLLAAAPAHAQYYGGYRGYGYGYGYSYPSYYTYAYPSYYAPSYYAPPSYGYAKPSYPCPADDNSEEKQFLRALLRREQLRAELRSLLGGGQDAGGGPPAPREAQPALSPEELNRLRQLLQQRAGPDK